LPTSSSQARSSEAKTKAEASFRKEERAKDGAKAMMEYQANGKALREKMARLKALRLAKEAADKEKEAELSNVVAAPKRTRKTAKKSSDAAGS
jgi:hypothetical protein